MDGVHTFVPPPRTVRISQRHTITVQADIEANNELINMYILQFITH